MTDRDLMRWVTPGLVALIAVEKAALDRRAERGVDDAIGYERGDTIASLTLCAASFAVPPLLSKLLGSAVPGRGRFGRVLVGGLVGAAAVTTAADRLAEHGTGRLAELARRVRPSTAVTTAATGILAGSLTWASRASARAVWERRGSTRDLGAGIAAHATALLAWDFLTYWDHRLRHTSRALWAVHSVHHSSEHFNFSTALRNPIAEPLMLFVPYGLLAWFGFRPGVIETARAIDLTYQYWLHTETIGTLGIAEEFLNTPSHHRVHHGSQPEYLDRNHGGILIVWDRLFGTFQREGRRVRYGLSGATATTNPVRIATDEYRSIARDVARATTWRDRIRAVLGRPGPGSEPDPIGALGLAS